MKRILLLALSLLNFKLATLAQIPFWVVEDSKPKIDFGLKIGFGMNKLYNIQSSYTPGFAGGAYADWRFRQWGICIEGLISKSRYVFADKSTYHNTYFDLPILFEYKVYENLLLQFGPQIHYNLSITSDIPTGSSDYKSNFNTSCFSLILGLETRYGEKLNYGFHYSHGINTYYGVVNSNSGTLLTGARSFSIFAGYKIR